MKFGMQLYLIYFECIYIEYEKLMANFIKCYYEGHLIYCVGSSIQAKLKSAFIRKASLTTLHELTILERYFMFLISAVF